MNSPNSLSVNSLDSLPIITTFVNAELNVKVRTLFLNNEPYFVGKDIAEILGYAKPQNAISEHVDEDDALKQGITDSLGRIQNTTLINESGVYSLVFGSKLPAAKKFKRWVTSEVLPSIRKSGGYSIPKTYSEALELATNQAKQIELMQPKADVYDKICNSETLKPVDQVASNLGYGKNNFFALMRGMGIFYYSTKDAEGKSINLPKQEYKDRGYFVTKEEPYNRGDKECLYTKIYVTGKGETWLAQKLNEETADAFIQKGEKEYQKIIDETAGNYLERAIENCPECNHTIVDLSESFSIEQVAKIIEEPKETVLNFIAAKGWIDPETKKPLLPFKYIDSNGRITVDGKDKIVSAFFIIKKTEKGMKSFSCGKGE